MKQTKQIELVKRYYIFDWPGYKKVWGTPHNLAMHFGYYGPGVKSHDESLANLNKKLAELINVTASDNVVDAGSGLGSSSLWLAKNRGCRVTGVNVIDWQNDLAQKHAKQQLLNSKVQFIEADFADTNLPSNSFTVFWGVESIVHAADREAVVKEAYRLIEPGGRFLISEYFLKENLSIDQKKLLQTWLDGWAMPQLLTINQHEHILKLAGFHNIRQADWSVHIMPSIDRLRKFFEPIYPFENKLKKLNIIDKEHWDSYETTRALIVAFDQKLWTYRVMYATKPK